MLPLALLFSSDEQASHSLSQALTELEFAVERCPEIFGAVEKITSRAFDIIVSDWHEGLEAAFLLKTSRELKANHAAFTIAVADPEAAEVAREAGADLILNRPASADEVKYALLTSDAFLGHMKTWLPKLGFSDLKEEEEVEKNAEVLPIVTRTGIAVSESPRNVRVWPSSPPPRKPEINLPVVAAESIFDEDPVYRYRVESLFHPEPSFSTADIVRRKEPRRLLPTIAIAVAFLSVGYVFSEPLYSHGNSTTVVQMWGRALGSTQSWFQSSNPRQATALVQTAQNGEANPTPSRKPSHIRVTPVQDPFQTAVPASTAAKYQPVATQASVAGPPPAAGIQIPESLKNPVQGSTIRNVAARITPLLAALEPVELSEDLSRRLLLQKVLPSYPEKAVRERLQGPVVLQAFIGRDGTIQELKLIRGSLLLGQAAYNAVRQWRYQPYVVNGRAVEAQTLVTVDFKLPSM
jgi:protein TonB